MKLTACVHIYERTTRVSPGPECVLVRQQLHLENLLTASATKGPRCLCRRILTIPSGNR